MDKKQNKNKISVFTYALAVICATVFLIDFTLCMGFGPMTAAIIAVIFIITAAILAWILKSEN